MSGEEDTELRDLVAQALENNGVLAKIRAELRANVFLALEEHDRTQAKPTFHNKPLKQFLHTTEGVVAASLVREFLDFFSLDFTLNVFDPEAYCNTEFCPSTRHELLQQLGLPEGPARLPVLSMLLQKPSVATTENFPEVQGNVNGNYSHFSSSSNQVLAKNKNECSQKSASPEPNHSIEDPSHPPNNDLPTDSDGSSDDSDHLLVAPKPLTPENNQGAFTNYLTRTKQLTIPVVPSTSKDVEENSPSLPPPMNPPPTSQETEKKLERIRAIMDLDSPASSLENYEEDFQSSVSGSQGETGEPKVAAASVSEEIEEEVITEGHSSNSLPLEELAQDLTCDTSISLKIALPADYLEDV